ncbi:MAG: helix-turn-helix transcriptional regulator [Lachnospiraceae bacterium]|nr:helix-turn-helix transcriptional regulator [Lachnospiraceae bacterium]MDE6184636.1 helix-turn-helix transcriptional regulator [Lachnospiraceae bacterium]MDE7286448.1 helix-turn-helix transcriptional regulator [Lachnospiraceae bacterium]
MSYSCKDIGFRVRHLRESNNYTRDVLAEKVDISAKFLYEIEMGKKGFTVEILYKLSKALNVSSDYILTGNETNKIPEKMVDTLECFDSDQMGRVQEILKVVHKMCIDNEK